MKMSLLPTLLLAILLQSTYAQDRSQALETIRERVVAELLAEEVDPSAIQQLLDTQKEDGTWPGIDYEDVSRTGFQHGFHLANLVEMARAYTQKGSEWRRVRQLKKAIHAGLDFWLANDFICDNWWWNQIGTPNALVRVMLLMDSNLTDEQVEKLLPIVGRAHLEAWGARPSGDRIKIAGIQAKRLLFLRDIAEFERVIEVIEGEIKFATGRGMQYDYSFHHRVDRVNNTLSYGLGYAEAFAEWAAYVAGTPYAFSVEKIRHLVDYYLDGIAKMMVYGKYPDLGAKNRSVSRPGTLKPMGTGTLERLKKATKYRWEEMTDLENIRKGYIKPNLSHSTFFWHSEYYTHQRPHFFASVRMFSERGHNMEVPYNGEGLRNHHLADASNFVSVTGQEYYDIFPVLDWQKIPGATILQKPGLPSEDDIQQPGLTDFVGAVTDGQYGAAAFDFKSPHDPLKAKKAWFFFDREYVCLGADIRARSSKPVVTAINQRRLLGEVVLGQGGDQNVIPHGEHQYDNAAWVYSDSIAYIFHTAGELHLTTGPATGSWFDINRQSDTPKEPVTLDVFKLWLNHGPRPDTADYAYIVVPGVGLEEAVEYQQNPEIEIISNTPEIQAVKHVGLNLCMIVFHQAGTLPVAEGLSVEMDSPGLVLLEMEGNSVKRVTVADPTRKLGKMHLSLTSAFQPKGEAVQANWDEGKKMTRLAIGLPRSVYAGSSVVVEGVE